MIGIALIVVGLSSVGKWDWNIAEEAVKSVEIEITEDFDEFKIEETSGDILMTVSEDGKCRVESWETENEKLVAQVVNGRLYAEREGRKEWSMFFWKDASGSKYKTVVYLPKEKYEKAELEATSGDIHAAVKLEVGELSMQSTSGNIELSGVTADLATITSTSGEISLKDVSAGDLLTSATSGGIVFNKVTAGKAAISCTSGDISLRNITADAIMVSGTSGDIELLGTKCGSVELNTNSGELEMEDVAAELAVKMKTTSGDISCVHTDGTEVMLESISGEIDFEHLKGTEILLESASGDVKGSIVGAMRYETKTTSGDIRVPNSGDGGECRINTTSGDIWITEANE